jgi:hypothetical protein
VARLIAEYTTSLVDRQQGVVLGDPPQEAQEKQEVVGLKPARIVPTFSFACRSASSRPRSTCSVAPG